MGSRQRYIWKAFKQYIPPHYTLMKKNNLGLSYTPNLAVRATNDEIIVINVTSDRRRSATDYFLPLCSGAFLRLHTRQVVSEQQSGDSTT